jgi:hypothetical protein
MAARHRPIDFAITCGIRLYGAVAVADTGFAWLVNESNLNTRLDQQSIWFEM